MLIAVFVEEVVNKINPALLDVTMLISLDADTLQALNIPFPMREIRLLWALSRRYFTESVSYVIMHHHDDAPAFGSQSVCVDEYCGHSADFRLAHGAAFL